MIAVTFAALALGAGCSDDDDTGGASDDPTLVVDDLTDVTSPLALADGRLAIQDGCVVIELPEGPALTVWPTGTHISNGDPAEVTLPDGTRIAIDGEVRTFVGGFAAPDVGEECAALADDLPIWLMARDPVS